MAKEPKEPDEAAAEQAAADDELAARRKLQADKDATEEAAVTGRSVEDMEASGELEEEDDGQVSMGVVESPGQVSLTTLMKKTTKKEVEVNLMSAAVPARGLPDPDVEADLIVTVLPNGYKFVPGREGGKTTKWAVRPQLRPTHIVAARSAQGFDSMVAILASGNPMAHNELVKVLEKYGLMPQAAA